MGFTQNVIQKSGLTSTEVTFRLPSIISSIQNYTQHSYIDSSSEVTDDLFLSSANNSLINVDGEFWEDKFYEVGDVILLLKPISRYDKYYCRYIYRYKVKIYTIQSIDADEMVLDQTIENDDELEGYNCYRLELGYYIEDCASAMTNWSKNSNNPSSVVSEKIGDTSYSLSDTTSQQLIYGYPQSVMSSLDADRCLPNNLYDEFYYYSYSSEDYIQYV